MKTLIFILFFIPIILKAQEPRVGNLSSILDRNDVTYLAKAWKVKVGDHPEWANPEYNDSSWQEISGNNLYNSEIQEQTAESNVVWFRKWIKIDSTTTQKLEAVILQSGASEIYLDGVLIKSLGKVSSNPDSIIPYNTATVPMAFPMKINKEQLLAIRYADTKKKFSLGQENVRQLVMAIQNEGYKQELHGNELAKYYIWLNGGWKFKVGDDPAWALPDVNDSLWETAFSSTSYLSENLKKYKTPPIIWLRKRIRTDSTIKQNVITQVYQIGASEIYLDGELIHKLGKVHANPDSVVPYAVPSYSALKNLSFPLQKQREYTLAIRFVSFKPGLPLISKSNNVFYNMLVSTLEADPFAAEAKESRRFFNYHYLVLGTTSFMVILFLALFLYFPSQKVNLYFSFASLFFALYAIFLIRGEYNAPYKTQYFLWYSFSLLGYLNLLYLSFYKAFERKPGRTFWVICWLGILISILSMLIDSRIDLMYLLALLMLSDFIRICWQAIKQKNRAALVLLILNMVNLIYYVALILNVFSVIDAPNIPRYFPFSLLIMPVGLAFYLGFSFGHTNQSLRKKLIEIKELSEEKQQILTDQNIKLEKLVNERTSDLKQSLENLKAAQHQLVQSEKMAALGELTAGIAHEIQNPLNFVNNFSELNRELIGEMNVVIDAGNLMEVKAIANAIHDNEDKISFHGKRADSIVKGMLQHSRSSSGVREPTDINALADEFLRLSYHGMRARDKSFNATLKSDFDGTIGKIKVVPDEIGRVILNLLNNAFYAVSEKKKQIPDGFEPAVSINTHRIGDHVEIKVLDNGNGIPQKLLDHIFQPFFTTKPTGQGTGLGLSISYDIVKAHGGDLTVKSTEGAGTEFMIRLVGNRE